MAYSTIDDLLVGDIAWSPRLDPEKFVNGAAEEIDTKLAVLYKYPLQRMIDGQPVLLEDILIDDQPTWELRLLKQINNKIASGRAIMAASVSSEDKQVHAYGQQLVNEGLAELMLIANGELLLDLTRVDSTVVVGERSRLPETINHDEESLLLGFENTVLRSEPFYSRPGAV